MFDYGAISVGLVIVVSEFTDLDGMCYVCGERISDPYVHIRDVHGINVVDESDAINHLRFFNIFYFSDIWVPVKNFRKYSFGEFMYVLRVSTELQLDDYELLRNVFSPFLRVIADRYSDLCLEVLPSIINMYPVTNISYFAFLTMLFVEDKRIVDKILEIYDRSIFEDIEKP